MTNQDPGSRNLFKAHLFSKLPPTWTTESANQHLKPFHLYPKGGDFRGRVRQRRGAHLQATARGLDLDPKSDVKVQGAEGRYESRCTELQIYPYLC